MLDRVVVLIALQGKIIGIRKYWNLQSRVFIWVMRFLCIKRFFGNLDLRKRGFGNLVSGFMREVFGNLVLRKRF